MMEPSVKRMSVAEFRRLGYLQELNRQFLHPLGLALESVVDGEEERFGLVQDSRDDPEGTIYDESMIDEEFRLRARRIAEEFASKEAARIALMGTPIQPID